jgi:hypothetical protein
MGRSGIDVASSSNGSRALSCIYVTRSTASTIGSTTSPPPHTTSSLLWKSCREILDFSAPQALLTLSIFKSLDVKPIRILPG